MYTLISTCMLTYTHIYIHTYRSVSAYIHSNMHAYTLVCLMTYIHTYIHTYVAEVNINVVGMNTFLFPMEFLHFGRKIPSLLHF